MAQRGWIKLYRKTLDNPCLKGHPERLAVFVYLLLNVTSKPLKRKFAGQEVMLQPGEIITGRQKIAEQTGVSESGVRYALIALEKAEIISVKNNLKNNQKTQKNNQKSKRSGSVISICSWNDYQKTTKKSEKTTKKTTTIQEVIQEDIQEYNNINNISVCVKGQRPHTHPYGKLDNVYLTADEYQDLKTTYQNSRQLINKVSLWLPDHERNNHYAVCLKFAQADNWPKAKQEQDTALLEAEAREMSEEEQAEADRVRAEVMQQIHRDRSGVDKEEQLQ